MAFIRYIPEDEQAPRDRVPDMDHIIQVHAVNPRVMRAHLDLYRALMHGPGPLSRREREVIAVRVSGLNDCPYWLQHHGAGLRLLLERDGLDLTAQGELVAHLMAPGPLRGSAFTPREHALVAYADRVTRDAPSTGAAHVAALRAVGLDDRAIHDACAIVAYFAFVNRVADGLGVELEPPPA